MSTVEHPDDLVPGETYRVRLRGHAHRRRVEFVMLGTTHTPAEGRRSLSLMLRDHGELMTCEWRHVAEVTR